MIGWLRDQRRLREDLAHERARADRLEAALLEELRRHRDADDAVRRFEDLLSGRWVGPRAGTADPKPPPPPLTPRVREAVSRLAPPGSEFEARCLRWVTDELARGREEGEVLGELLTGGGDTE